MVRLALALFITALAGWPAAGQARVLWLCGLSDDGTRLVCVADPDLPAAEPTSPGTPSTVQPLQGTPTVVRGTRFPLDPAHSYTVDLWSPPSDATWVQHLAQASLCHRSPDCATWVAPSPWLAEPARATARPAPRGWR